MRAVYTHTHTHTHTLRIYMCVCVLFVWVYDSFCFCKNNKRTIDTGRMTPPLPFSLMEMETVSVALFKREPASQLVA